MLRTGDQPQDAEDHVDQSPQDDDYADTDRCTNFLCVVASLLRETQSSALPEDDEAPAITQIRNRTLITRLPT